MADFKYLTLGAAQPLGATGNTMTSYTFVNNTDQVEAIFQVPDNHGSRTMTITQVGYRSTAVGTGTPNFRMELQGVTAAGIPDNTIKGAGNSAFTADFAFTGTNAFNWVALGTPYTANCGDFLAWVFKYRSGTINGQQIGVNYASAGSQAFPLQITNVATVRTRNLGVPIMGIGTSSFKFGFPLQSITATAFSTTTEKGMAFTIPSTFLSTYKVAGARFQVTLPAAGKSELISLYQGTTSLQSLTLDTDVLQANANTRQFTVWFQDAALATLSGGVEYVIAIAPQDALNNIALSTWDVATADDLEAFPGGQAWYAVTRATGGATAFTPVLTSRPMVELIISDWTVPAPQIVMGT